MTKINKLILLSITVSLFACSDDDGPDYKFKDQDLAGEIENQSWVYADGYSDLMDNYLGTGKTYIDIKLVLDQPGSGCDMDVPDGDMVFFAVPAEVGLYKLSFSLATFKGQTVTLLADTPIPTNNIATEGAIEIISIFEDQVTGRIDARCDKQNFVNGNFTVSICH